MAGKRHPPKIIFRGDWEAGQKLVRRGKQELIRTADLADRLGAPHYHRRTLIDPHTGAFIESSVDGDLQLIEIMVPHGAEEVYEEEIPTPEKEEEIKRQLYVGIYSGFAHTHQRSYDFTSGPPPLDEPQWLYRLHEFNPTIACREAYPDDFTAASYQPITRLSSPAHYNIWNYDASEHDEGWIDSWRFDLPSGLSDPTQTNLVHACQYSGPIARACSLALGNGTFNLFNADDRVSIMPEDAHPDYINYVRTYGYSIEYDFHTDRTHNAMKDNLGQWWLIQVGYQGIFARRLPVIPWSKEPEDPTEAAAVAEFGGIPSGEAMPYTTWKLWEKVDAGEWLLLKDPDDPDWDSFSYDEQFTSHNESWCFNDTGTEGRCCTYDYNTTGFCVFSYWKLNFQITTDPESGVSTGSATLTKISSSIVARPALWSFSLNRPSTSLVYYLPQTVYQPGYNNWFNFGLPASSTLYTTPAKFAEIPVEMEQVTWVGWIDGQWHEMKFRARNIGKWDIRFSLYEERSYSELGYSGWVYSQDGNKAEQEYVYYFMHNSPAFTEDHILYKQPDAYKKWVQSYTIGADLIRLTTSQCTASGSNPLFEYYKVKTIWKIDSWGENVSSKLMQQWVYFVTAPYNRNAYYIYKQRYRSPGGIHWGSEYPVYVGYSDCQAFWWRNNNDPQYGCSDPAYPYNYMPALEVCAEVGGNPQVLVEPTYVSPWILSFNYGPGVPGSEWDFTIGFPAWSNPSGPYQTFCSGNYTCYCDNLLWNRFLCSSRNQAFSDPGGYSFITPDWPVEIVTEDFSPGAAWPYTDSDSYDSGYAPSDLTGYAPATFPRPFYAQLPNQDLGITEYDRVDMSLVGDRLPGSTGTSPLELGFLEFDDLDGLYNAPSSNDTATSFWCQTAVLGAEAAIYADPMDGGLTYNNQLWPYWFMPMTAVGTSPALPTSVPGNIQYATTDLNTHYRFLTFVGVNGP